MKNLIVIVSLMIVEILPLQAQEQMVFSSMGKNIDFPTKTMATKIVQEAYRRLNISVKVIGYPALRSLVTSNSGKVDGELFRLRNLHKKYTNLLMIPVPLYRVEWGVFTKDKNFVVNGCESLRPYTIAIERGIPPAENCTKGMRVQAISHEVQIFLLVLAGRVDIGLDVILDGKFVMLKAGVKGLRILQPPVMANDIFHYLHKKHKNIAFKVTTAIYEVVDEGLHKKFEEEILADYVKQAN